VCLKIFLFQPRKNLGLLICNKAAIKSDAVVVAAFIAASAADASLAAAAQKARVWELRRLSWRRPEV
jgi:hypothetical protein